MSQNPYRSPSLSPEHSDQPKRRKGAKRKFLESPFAWVVVLAFNLPVPVLLAAPMLSGVAWIGVWAATLCTVLVGAIGMTVAPKVMKLGVTGGVFTAMSQAVPILQLAAGLLAISVGDELFGIKSFTADDKGGYHQLMAVEAFALTVITAAIIAGAAFTIGLVLNAALVGWRQLTKKEPNDSADHLTAG